MKLKDWEKTERPREKMALHGPKSMSNAELLAILLRTGTGNKNVIELAQEILSSQEDGLRSLSRMDIGKLCGFKGVGIDKAVTLTAALELGYRCAAALMKPDCLEIRTPETVFKIMLPKMMGIDHEECWIIYLNRANRIISTERCSSGGLSETTVDISTIARKALEKRASGVIISHNHPSGNPIPSRNDIEITSRLKKALSVFDISLIDHVIISEGCWYSFADESTGFMQQ